MKISYYPDTDSLYVELSGGTGAGTVRVSDALVVDVDNEGRPVGLDIDANASGIVDLSRVVLERFEEDAGATMDLDTGFMLRLVEGLKNVG